jgi:hypothetical protein
MAGGEKPEATTLKILDTCHIIKRRGYPVGGVRVAVVAG